MYFSVQSVVGFSTEKRFRLLLTRRVAESHVWCVCIVGDALTFVASV